MPDKTELLAARKRWQREYRDWLSLGARGSHLADAAWRDVERAERALEKLGGSVTQHDLDEAYALSPTAVSRSRSSRGR